MKQGTASFGLILLLAAYGSGQAQAQEEDYGNRPWEFNLHAGGTEKGRGGSVVPLFGARGVWNAPSGWGFGANFDNVVPDFDAKRFLYSVEVDYTFPSSNRAHFFVGAGIGATTLKYGRRNISTDLLVPVAGGLKWFNRTNDPSWAIRADVRDNIYFGEEYDRDEQKFVAGAQSNIEFSVGISFLFGGGT